REVSGDRLVALASLEQPVRCLVQRLATWHRLRPQCSAQWIAPGVSDARPAILERLDPGASRETAFAGYGRCHRRVVMFDPQREPEGAAAVLAGTSEQRPGKLREQILLAMCPFEHARERAGTGSAPCGADRGEHGRPRRERRHPFVCAA